MSPMRIVRFTKPRFPHRGFFVFWVWPTEQDRSFATRHGAPSNDPATGQSFGFFRRPHPKFRRDFPLASLLRLSAVSECAASQGSRAACGDSASAQPG